MKKFSTATFFLAFAFTAFTFIPLASSAASKRCAFLPNAPDQHKVVRGDTLWGISGKFLEHPWCWPQVWNLNRDQIRNPHWIYPGQIVYFDRLNGRLSLNKPGSGTSNGRLSPRIRSEELGKDAIGSIPASEIEPFLSQPLIVEENELKFLPRIVATQEGRVFLGKGDKAYVRGDLKDNTSFQAFRPGMPLKDPVTKEVLGYEAAFLGSVKLKQAGKTSDEAHTFEVVMSKEEMGVGDRLMAVTPTPFINYVPHAPEQAIEGRIMSVYGGVSQAGRDQIVTVNRGSSNGLDVGSVLQLYRFGQVIKDKTDPVDQKTMVKLPDEQYGTLFIFRVFNRIAYGLVMTVTDSVQIGDVARSPEQ